MFFLKNNKKDNELLLNGKSCFIFQDIKRIEMNYIDISDSYNERTTVGIIIINKENEIAKEECQV